MEIDINALMEETNFKRMLTIKKLQEVTGKSLKECSIIVTPFYESEPEAEKESILKEIFEPDGVSDILYLILDEIRESNRKLDCIENAIQEIKGSGLYNSLTDICNKIDSAKDEIRGTGYNSLTDICDKLD